MFGFVAIVDIILKKITNILNGRSSFFSTKLGTPSDEMQKLKISLACPFKSFHGYLKSLAVSPRIPIESQAFTVGVLHQPRILASKCDIPVVGTPRYIPGCTIGGIHGQKISIFPTVKICVKDSSVVRASEPSVPLFIALIFSP
jgi:hypothetical protein